MADAEIISHMLEDIKDVLEYSLQNNECTRIFFGKVHGHLGGSRIPTDSYGFSDSGSMEQAGKDGNPEPLENILHEKLQENARLKALNGRLLMNTRQKSQKIKELTRAVSLQGQLVQNSKAISLHRDILGRCNVEIQKLRKQLKLETKRLQNEKARSVRQETLTGKSRDKLNAVKSAKGCSTWNKNVEENGAPRAKPSPPLDKLMYEDRLQRKLQMIELQKEPSIHDETLDMPESLDSDSDEKCQCV